MVLILKLGVEVPGAYFIVSSAGKFHAESVCYLSFW